MISDKREVSDFLAELSASGISDVVLSPGSRNAPFSISLFEHPKFNVIPVVDERSAAFIALGIAQQTGRPAVLICTSGTAILNYGPAVAEAYYQRIPMLVVSADRPAEWIDHGEGQSIRQSGVFRNISKLNVDITPAEGIHDREMENLRVMREAIRSALSPAAGPVHLNFPFYEPLYGMREETEGRLLPETPAVVAEQPDYSAFREAIQPNSKVLLLVGQIRPMDGLNEAVHSFAQRNGIAVMSESHSNLAHPDFITTIDRLIMGWDNAERERYAPDVLITIGNNIISRKVKAWLRASACAHWCVDDAGGKEDTFRKLKGVLPASPLQFLDDLSDLSLSSSYASELIQLNRSVRTIAAEVVSSLPFSDLVVTGDILSHLPAGWDMQMGNSAVVRYIQLYDSRSDIRYFGNRGVSGIDGVTSTSVGAAHASQRPTLLITGDIAFLYDSNAFWNALRPKHLRIIVLNNAGGGIFRIIDGPQSSPALGAYFETTHERSAGEVAAMYSIPFHSASDPISLSSGFEWLFGQEEMSILEICTPRLANDEVLKSYFRQLKERLNT